MDYKIYFINAKHHQISFDIAFNMLSALLEIVTTLSEQELMKEVEQYKY